MSLAKFIRCLLATARCFFLASWCFLSWTKRELCGRCPRPYSPGSRCRPTSAVCRRQPSQYVPSSLSGARPPAICRATFQTVPAPMSSLLVSWQTACWTLSCCRVQLEVAWFRGNTVYQAVVQRTDCPGNLHFPLTGPQSQHSINRHMTHKYTKCILSSGNCVTKPTFKHVIGDSPTWWSSAILSNERLVRSVFFCQRKGHSASSLASLSTSFATIITIVWFDALNTGSSCCIVWRLPRASLLSNLPFGSWVKRADAHWACCCEEIY